jgi:hypothetical protein
MAYGSILSDSITDSSGGVLAPSSSVFRNRLINSDMRIDQRRAGASVTPTTDITYTLDRYCARLTQASKFSVQQNAASVTPPVGYVNYLGATSLSAYTVLTGDYFGITQVIEGFNIADLGWGTASAATVTLSFWVRSSLTGTFGGSLGSYSYTRSYPFTFTINAANTWEQKTITIAGDTTGTWKTDNLQGIYLNFSLGTGASVSGTAGSWAGATYLSATGATSVVGTNGATFYITGVQLEKGSTATSFDYRPYGTELQLCQRYFRALKSGLVGFWNSSTSIRLQCTWLGMRATPSFSQSGTLTITDNSINATQSSASVSDNGSDADGGQLVIGNVSGGTANRVAAVLSASAGSILVSAEL